MAEGMMAYAIAEDDCFAINHLWIAPCAVRDSFDNWTAADY